MNNIKGVVNCKNSRDKGPPESNSVDPNILFHKQGRNHTRMKGGFLYGSGRFWRVDVAVSLLADVLLKAPESESRHAWVILTEVCLFYLYTVL